MTTHCYKLILEGLLTYLLTKYAKNFVEMALWCRVLEELIGIRVGSILADGYLKTCTAFGWLLRGHVCNIFDSKTSYPKFMLYTFQKIVLKIKF